MWPGLGLVQYTFVTLEPRLAPGARVCRRRRPHQLFVFDADSAIDILGCQDGRVRAVQQSRRGKFLRPGTGFNNMQQLLPLTEWPVQRRMFGCALSARGGFVGLICSQPLQQIDGNPYPVTKVAVRDFSCGDCLICASFPEAQPLSGLDHGNGLDFKIHRQPSSRWAVAQLVPGHAASQVSYLGWYGSSGSNLTPHFAAIIAFNYA